MDVRWSRGGVNYVFAPSFSASVDVNIMISSDSFSKMQLIPEEARLTI